MEQLTVCKMYCELIERGFNINVMYLCEWGAFEIDIHRLTEIEKFIVDRVEINKYNSECCTMYIKEV